MRVHWFQTVSSNHFPKYCPAHLWSVDYVKLLWSDTGAVLTAPAHWNEVDWMYAGFSAARVGAAASLDNTIKDNVHAHRTTGEDRFFNQLFASLGEPLVRGDEALA